MRKTPERSRRRMPRCGRLPLATAIALALGAGAAHAQNAPPAPEEGPVLETITVTAEKRSEDVQKVPISITVLGEEDIERQNINDFEDIVRQLPSVTFQQGTTGGVGSGPAFNQVYMR